MARVNDELGVRLRRHFQHVRDDVLEEAVGFEEARVPPVLVLPALVVVPLGVGEQGGHVFRLKACGCGG